MVQSQILMIKLGLNHVHKICALFRLRGNVGMWFWALFLVSACVNREDLCYSRSSEQGSPKRK